MKRIWDVEEEVCVQKAVVRDVDSFVELPTDLGGDERTEENDDP